MSFFEPFMCPVTDFTGQQGITPTTPSTTPPIQHGQIKHRRIKRPRWIPAVISYLEFKIGEKT